MGFSYQGSKCLISIFKRIVEVFCTFVRESCIRSSSGKRQNITISDTLYFLYSELGTGTPPTLHTPSVLPIYLTNHVYCYNVQSLCRNHGIRYSVSQSGIP